MIFLKMFFISSSPASYSNFSFQLLILCPASIGMDGLSMQKTALIPLKFEVIFNYDTLLKVAQSYPHGPKLAQLTVLDFPPLTYNGQVTKLAWPEVNDMKNRDIRL